MKNNIVVKENLVVVTVKEYKFLFDLIDLEYLQSIEYKFGVHKGKGDSFYLRYGRSELVHRDIMKAPKGLQVDHINRNTLDNTRSNLRVVTASENMLNRGTFSNTGEQYISRSICKSKYKGKVREYVYYSVKLPNQHGKKFKTLEQAIEYRQLHIKEVVK